MEILTPFGHELLITNMVKIFFFLHRLTELVVFRSFLMFQKDFIEYCFFADAAPMSQRNFPPSFWNSQHYQGAAGSHHPSELYSEHYHPEAWYQYSTHHRAVHDYHHNMAQYGSLLLPGSRLHMGSHTQCKAMEWQHPPLDAPYSSYPSMSGKNTK